MDIIINIIDVVIERESKKGEWLYACSTKNCERLLFY